MFYIITTISGISIGFRNYACILSKIRVLVLFCFVCFYIKIIEIK